MNTSQQNSHDQQTTDILLDTSMVDGFHEEIVAEENDFRAMNVQPNLAGNRNVIKPNSRQSLRPN
jgi:hypothetical protein